MDAPKDFAAFILTHGRPNRVTTYGTLRRSGYTGPIYIIIDDEDPDAAAYRERYGSEVVSFSKSEAAAVTDAGDNFQRRDSVVYARNACWGIAEWLGVSHFIELDDDYSDFRYVFGPDREWGWWFIRNLDDVFRAMVDFLEVSGAATVAMCQTGDMIGGPHSGTAERIALKRKAMNTFICATARPFSFLGRMNDDVSTYVYGGSVGRLYLQTSQVAINQAVTQQKGGGLTDMYQSFGTYVKSFYTVMWAPSCVHVGVIGAFHPRIHHQISWNNAVPCIVAEEYRKASQTPLPNATP